MSERASARRDVKSIAFAGFSLLEMMISIVILLGVSAVVMSGLLQSSRTEGTVENRTEMHAAVRSATELLQQEIGQAGRVSLPAAVTLTSAVTGGASSSPTVSSVTGMFVGEYLVVDAGIQQETVQVTALGANTVTATFQLGHSSGVPVLVQGGFGTGIVPEAASPYNMTNGSDGTHLKLYGDINGDGNMVYVEYVCDTTGGNLYRSVTAFNAATIVAKTVLLPNLLANPGSQPCFVYQERPPGCTSTPSNPCFVVDVSVTLTVQTQQPDPYTGKYQTETKALLNVSPRNVFDAYNLSTASNSRVQPIPTSIGCLSGVTCTGTPLTTQTP